MVGLVKIRQSEIKIPKYQLRLAQWYKYPDGLGLFQLVKRGYDVAASHSWIA